MIRAGLLIGMGLIVQIAGIGSAFGIGLEHDLRGYVKTYPMLIHDDATDWLVTTRSRVKFRWFPSAEVTVAADYDVTFLMGSLVDKSSFSFFQTSLNARQNVVDLTWSLVDKRDVFVTHTLDRIYFEYYSERVIVTIGRQRIAWGVSNFFQPLDPFAPFAPSQIDKEERTGIDAVRISMPWGQLSNVEVVYNPYQNFEDQRFGARFRTNIRQWDVGFIAGSFDAGESAGMSVAGSVGGAAIRSEALITRGDARRWVVWRDGSGFEMLNTEGWHSRVALGTDYGFDWHNLTVGGEWYYDGSGQTAQSDYDWEALFLGRRVTLAQNYAAVSGSLLVTPLLTLSSAFIFNLDDNSFVFLPQMTYSITQQFDVRGGFQIFGGGHLTEYGDFPDRYYFIFSRYF